MQPTKEEVDALIEQHAGAPGLYGLWGARVVGVLRRYRDAEPAHRAIEPGRYDCSECGAMWKLWPSGTWLRYPSDEPGQCCGKFNPVCAAPPASALQEPVRDVAKRMARQLAETGSCAVADANRVLGDPTEAVCTVPASADAPIACTVLGCDFTHTPKLYPEAAPVPDVDALIARLRYHGEYCLDPHREQSETMLAAANALVSLQEQRDTEIEHCTYLREDLDDLRKQLAAAEADVKRLQEHGPTADFGWTTDDDKPVLCTMRQALLAARDAADEEANHADSLQERHEAGIKVIFELNTRRDEWKEACEKARAEIVSLQEQIARAEAVIHEADRMEFQIGAENGAWERIYLEVRATYPMINKHRGRLDAAMGRNTDGAPK